MSKRREVEKIARQRAREDPPNFDEFERQQGFEHPMRFEDQVAAVKKFLEGGDIESAKLKAEVCLREMIRRYKKEDCHLGSDEDLCRILKSIGIPNDKEPTSLCKVFYEMQEIVNERNIMLFF